MDCSNCGREYPYYYDKCPYCGTINVDTKERQQQPGESANDYHENYGQGYNVQQNNYQQYNRQPYNGGYQQPVYSNYDRYNEPVSIGSWIGVWFLMCIPIVGFIMLIVWACGGTSKQSLKNWARAQLILMLIFVLIGLIVTLIMYATGHSLFAVRYY